MTKKKSRKKKSTKRAKGARLLSPKRVAVPYQFGRIGSLKTRYYDLETGDELGSRPSSRKYRIL
jgi:hypothetical protein